MLTYILIINYIKFSYFKVCYAFTIIVILYGITLIDVSLK